MPCPAPFLELARRDRRAAVLGLAGCIRRHRLARLEAIDPRHSELLDEIEAWARGEADDDALADIAARAHHVPGGYPLCRLVELATAEPADFERIADALMVTMAIGVWTVTPAGRAWTADPKNRGMPFLQDPVAERGVRAQEERLWSLALQVAEHHAPPSVGRGVLVETVDTLAGLLWIVRSDADPQPGDRVVVGDRAHVIERVEVMRSPFDPPPPRTLALGVRGPATPPEPGAEVVFVRGTAGPG